ncbi:MAG: hypothetical protein AAB383_03670 [Patescibacteria group bacterium]
MSILDLALGLNLARYEETAPAAESAYVDSSYMERAVVPALQAADNGMQTALKLEKLINQRGRNSENASLCRTLVNDCFIGFDDLRTVLKEVEAGNPSATKKIPGILASIQEAMNLEALLSQMKAYVNKDKEKALPTYVHETLTELEQVFNGACDGMRGISDVLDVQLQVRRSMTKALDNYKFHGVQQASAQPAAVQAAAVVEAEPVAEAPFSPVETAWFEEATVAESAPAQASKGFLARMKAVAGEILGSFGRSLPRAAMVGAMLSVGCGTPEEAPTPPPAPAPLTIKAIPSAPAPAPAPIKKWTIGDSSSIWKAVDSALAEKCPSLTKADRTKKTGTLVHSILVKETSGLTKVIEAQQVKDTESEWLGKVVTDEARYGNEIPGDYPGVLESKGATRIAGAHGLSSVTIVANTLAGLPNYNTYSCAK